MKEIRVIEVRAEESSAEAQSFIISGRPIVYDSPTTIHDLAGDYIEVIKRGALDHADLSDVRLLVNHDANRLPLARVPKTMSLNIDQAGLTFKATLPNTEAGKEAYEAVKRGDLTGMSFAFTVPDQSDSYDAKTNTRTINEIAKVYECSLVNFPAYEATYVSVESRSARQASRAQFDARQKAKILYNQIMKERW